MKTHLETIRKSSMSGVSLSIVIDDSFVGETFLPITVGKMHLPIQHKCAKGRQISQGNNGGISIGEISFLCAIAKDQEPFSILVFNLSFSSWTRQLYEW